MSEEKDDPSLIQIRTWIMEIKTDIGVIKEDIGAIKGANQIRDIVLGAIIPTVIYLLAKVLNLA